MKKDIVIAEDVAIGEVKDFVEYFTDEDLEDDAVKANYPQIIKAVQYGLLTFDDEKNPKYVLKEPVKSESGSVAISEISFLTRLTVADQKRMAKGLDMQKDSLEYTFKALATIIKQPVAMLDKFGRFDYKALSQIASLFLV